MNVKVMKMSLRACISVGVNGCICRANPAGFGFQEK